MILDVDVFGVVLQNRIYAPRFSSIDDHRFTSRDTEAGRVECSGVTAGVGDANVGLVRHSRGRRWFDDGFA